MTIIGACVAGLAALAYLTLKQHKRDGVMLLYLGFFSVWSIGQAMLLLPAWTSDMFAKAAINTAPVMAAILLVFCLRLIRLGFPYVHAMVVAIGGILTLVAWLTSAGEIVAWLDFPKFYRAGRSAWLVWTTLGMYAMALALLSMTKLHAQIDLNRKIRAMRYACAVGLLGYAGFLNIEWIDFGPILALVWPFHPILLVYASLRYESIEINHVAHKFAAWSLFAVVAVGVYLGGAFLYKLSPSPFLGDSFGPLLALSGVALLLTWFNRNLLNAVAERLIYLHKPTSEVDMVDWTERINCVKEQKELREVAQDLLSDFLGQFVGVEIRSLHDYHILSEPRLICERVGSSWRYKLEGWQMANPAQQHAAEKIASLLTERLQMLDTQNATESRANAVAIDRELKTQFDLAGKALDILEKKAEQPQAEWILPIETLSRDVVAELSQEYKIVKQQENLGALLRQIKYVVADNPLDIQCDDTQISWNIDRDKFLQCMSDWVRLCQPHLLCASIQNDANASMLLFEIKPNPAAQSAPTYQAGEIVTVWLRLHRFARAHHLRLGYTQTQASWNLVMRMDVAQP